jgi:hypothetical protein
VRSVLVTVVLVAGLALLVGLFFVFRGGSEDEPRATPTTETTATEGTTTEESTIEATPTTEATTTTEPERAVLRVRVRGGQPVGGIQRLRVRQGEQVRVRVASDVADHVHVHGYDLFTGVGAGREARIEFRATIVGRFEIELEDRGTPIAELEVRP